MGLEHVSGCTTGCRACRTPRVVAVYWGNGWHSGKSICLPPMWPEFDSWTGRHTWVEFVVVGRPPCSGVGLSPGSLVFIPPQKPTLPNSNSISEQWKTNHPVEIPLQIAI